MPRCELKPPANVNNVAVGRRFASTPASRRLVNQKVEKMEEKLSGPPAPTGEFLISNYGVKGARGQSEMNWVSHVSSQSNPRHSSTRVIFLPTDQRLRDRQTEFTT
ncbi:hypothetical protein E2C01_045065 [Portunus trituberculatus]|uniref:Uncharacterized protein n=1 Tax=Portunus trituberculatus TaxID=210409 RepID=A0A5B7FX92_PORTR|nr:hypothetical protein [Portunus trituberculatus]